MVQPSGKTSERPRDQSGFGYTQGALRRSERGGASQMVSITSRPRGVALSPQTDPQLEKGYLKKICGCRCFTRVNLKEFHRRPVRAISAEIPACPEMYRESTNEVQPRESRILLAENRLVKLPSRKYMLIFVKKKR